MAALLIGINPGNTTSLIASSKTASNEVVNINEIKPDSNHPKEIYWGRSDLKSVEKMLSVLKVNVYPEDKVYAFPPPQMGLGSKITVWRAMPVVVVDWGKEKNYRTWQKTIGGLLNEQGLETGKQDKVEPGVENLLSTNLAVVITRVAETDVSEDITLPYATVERDDASLEYGIKKTGNEGLSGKRIKVYHIRRENGVIISKILKSDKVAKAPVDKVILNGTKKISYGSGVASYYIRTSRMIAACNVVSSGTLVDVVNLSNGKSVRVTCVGGGLRRDRIIDLSTAAFEALGVSTRRGLIYNVKLLKVYN